MAAVDSASVGRARRKRRRWLLGSVLPVALLGVWLASHLVPRRAHFVQRRGTVARVEAGSLIRDQPGFVSQAARITASTGLAVDLRVLRPEAADATRRLPLVILLGGHRTGRDAVAVVGDPGGIAIAALDYPYHGPERPRGLWQSLRTVPAAQDGLLDTPPAISLALDWLVTQPWVDPARIELMGVSLGVPFAAVAGALDRRFQRVWLVHGGVNNRAWLAQRLESRIENGPARHSAAWLLHLLAHGASFKTESWTPGIAPRRIVIIGARADEQVPRDRVEALFAASREPKELLWSDGGHVDTDKIEIVRQLLAMVRARVEADARP